MASQMFGVVYAAMVDVACSEDTDDGRRRASTVREQSNELDRHANVYYKHNSQ